MILQKYLQEKMYLLKYLKNLVKSGSKVRCISTKNTKDKPRSFFDNIDKWAKEQGASGLAYFTFEKEEQLSAKGPIGKFFSKEALEEIMKKTNSEVGDSIFMACGKQNDLEKITALARDKIAKDLDLIDDDIVLHFVGLLIIQCLKRMR